MWLEILVQRIRNTLERTVAMPYQEEMQPNIPVAEYQGSHTPESKMRSFLGTILAPCIALFGLALVAFAPSPSEIAYAFRPIGVETQIVTGGSDDERQTIQSLAERIELAVGPDFGETTDCFDDLRTADNAKLEKCGKLLYQALAEVNENPAVFQTDVAQSTSRETLMQELKLAATEVCRERWSREEQIPPDSPACEVAMAQPIAPSKN
jgi:hypothetical protein